MDFPRKLNRKGVLKGIDISVWSHLIILGLPQEFDTILPVVREQGVT